MKKRGKKIGKTYLVYASEVGKNQFFVIDEEIAEKTGLRSTIESIGAVLSEFGGCSLSGRHLAHAEKKGKTKDAKRFRAKLKEHHKRGMPKIKQVKSSLEKLTKDIDKLIPSDAVKKDFDISKLKEKLLSANLSDREKGLFETEFTKAMDAVRQDKKEAILQYLLKKMDELEDAAKDEEKAFIPRSPSFIAGFIIGCIVGAIVVVAAIWVWNEIVVPAVEFIADVYENLTDTVEDTVDEISDYSNCVFVANPNTKEVHNCSRRQLTCHLTLLSEPIFLDTEEEALDYIENKGYNGCAWCYYEYDTG